MRKFITIAALVAAVGSLEGEQLETGYSFTNEVITAQKLNDAVNKATAKPGVIGEQTQFTGAVESSDELLLRRSTGNTLVRVTVAQVQVPPGVVIDYAGGVVPAGWLACNGAAVSRTTYAPLFEAIGTIYGPGDGSTTFNLPDARGRVTAGRDVVGEGGLFAGVLNNTGTGNPGLNSQTLGAKGGADRLTLSLAQMPSHAHTITATTTTGSSGAAVTRGGSGGSFVNIGSAGAGGSEAHPNVQPTLILNKIIKY